MTYMFILKCALKLVEEIILTDTVYVPLTQPACASRHGTYTSGFMFH